MLFKNTALSGNAVIICTHVFTLQLQLTVPFAIQSVTATDISVAKCARQEITALIHRKFESNLKANLSEHISTCGTLQIQTFNITDSMWDCKEPYVLTVNDVEKVCVKDTSTVGVTSPSAVSVTTLSTLPTTTGVAPVDNSALLHSIPVYMVVLSLKMTGSQVLTNTCQSDFQTFTADWLKRNISSWCPAMVSNVSDFASQVINPTKVSEFLL